MHTEAKALTTSAVFMYIIGSTWQASTQRFGLAASDFLQQAPRSVDYSVA